MEPMMTIKVDEVGHYDTPRKCTHDFRVCSRSGQDSLKMRALHWSESRSATGTKKKRRHRLGHRRRFRPPLWSTTVVDGLILQCRRFTCVPNLGDSL